MDVDYKLTYLSDGAYMSVFLPSSATAFLESYVEDTDVLPVSDEALLILVLWVAITVGRILGVIDQTFIDTNLLYNHLTVFLVGGILSFALILIMPCKCRGQDEEVDL